MAWSNTFNPTSLIAGDFGAVARPITVLSGSTLAIGATVQGVTSTVLTTVLPRGTVLGRITASDKYIPSKTGASDGSQTPVAILAADTDPSGGDATTDAYFVGEFAGELLSFDVSWTVTTLANAFRTALSTLFIRSIGALG